MAKLLEPKDLEEVLKLIKASEDKEAKALEAALQQIKTAEEKALWAEIEQAEREYNTRVELAEREHKRREDKILQEQIGQLKNMALNNKASAEQRQQNEAEEAQLKADAALALLKADEDLARHLSRQAPAHNEQIAKDAAIAKAYAAADSVDYSVLGEWKKIAEKQALMDHDAALAFAEQEREDGKISAETRAEQLLQYEQVVAAQIRRNALSPEEWKKMSDELQVVLNSPAVVSEYEPGKPGVLMDAHKYTRTDIRYGLPVLYGIDNKFNISRSDIGMEQVLKEALEHAERANNNNSKINIDSIKETFAHLRQHKGLEDETQTNPFELLSRSWDLAKKTGLVYITEIVTAYSDNKNDEGGCIAGLCARLHRPYAKMIGIALDMNSTAKPTAKP